MKQPNLKQNFIYRVLYEILVLLTPFITTPYVSRIFQADGIGNYSYTYSIITFFMLFGALGTVGYGTREIAQHRDDRYVSSKLFWEIEIMTVMTTGVCLIVWIFLIIFDVNYKLYFLMLTPFLLGTMFDISWYFTGLEKIKNIVVRNSLVKILGIILVFSLIRTKDDIFLYCLINSSTAFLGNISMWLYLPGMLTKVKFRELQFRKHFRETMIYFIPTIATSIYTVLDKTLIGVITGSSYQNGYYEQATKVIKIVKALVFTSVNSVLSARQSYLFSEERYDEIKSKISNSMNFIYLLAYGAIFGIIAVAPKFVPIFFGNGYEPVIPLLRLMSPLVLIVGTSNCLGAQYYTPSGQRKRSAKVIVWGSIINLIINLILIPHFGAVGATISTIAAESFISALYIYMSAGYMTWKQIWTYSYKRMISGLIMLLLIVFLGRYISVNNFLILVIMIISGGITYLGILALLRDSMIKELYQIIHNFIYKRISVN